jgi:hypothetical protein
MRRPPFFCSRQFLWGGLWLILIVAVGLRIGDYASRYRYARMNDLYDHMLYIDYVRHHFAPPLPCDGFEFYQQPFYYWLAACVYSPTLPVTSDENWANVAAMGLVLNLAGLWILFCTLKYLSSWLVRYGLLIFIGLTPSFVLHCAIIGNDALAAFFGMAYFYCLQRFNRRAGKTSNFWSAIAVFMLQIFTKLNGIVLFLSLPWLFWKASAGRLFERRMLVRAGILLLLGMVWIGSVIHHAWIPNRNEYLLVEWWPFPDQGIKVSKLHYALHFSLPDLIEAGQTTTHVSKVPLHPQAVDNVRFSFWTWTLGNMLLGSWDYNVDVRVHEAASVVIVFGTIFPLGLGLFAAITLLGPWLTRNARFSPFNATALALTVGMAALSLQFTLTHPTVCAADFRLEAVTFAWMGYCSCRGWTVFPRSRALRTVAIVFLVGYVLSSFTLYGLLCASSQPPYTF